MSIYSGITTSTRARACSPIGSPCTPTRASPLHLHAEGLFCCTTAEGTRPPSISHEADKVDVLAISTRKAVSYEHLDEPPYLGWWRLMYCNKELYWCCVQYVVVNSHIYLSHPPFFVLDFCCLTHPTSASCCSCTPNVLFPITQTYPEAVLSSIMSDPVHIHAVDDGIHSVSKEGGGAYAVRQRSITTDDVAEKGAVELDERDIRKKQVLLRS